MNKEFFISVPVKSHIKKYLAENYGEPVRFPKYKFENIFMNALVRKDVEVEREDEINYERYPETVEVVISDRTFYKRGWEFEREQVVLFNMYFDNVIKQQARILIGMYKGFGRTLVEAAEEFQRIWNFTEQEYSSESILKDFNRHGPQVEAGSYLRPNIFKNFFSKNCPIDGTEK